MAASLPIPVYTNLQEVYQNLGTSLKHAERWDNLAKAFKTKFGRTPAYIARAPGRVNLIGEHLDYSLFGVFPCAIEHDILIACAPRAPAGDPTPGSVVVDNLHKKYEPQVFAPTRKPTVGAVGKEDVPKDAVHVEAWHLDINKAALGWEGYVKAGYYGVLNHYFPSEVVGSHPVPVDLLVTGTVPPGSGLSSSAAMVVSSTLAFLAINGILEDPDIAPTKGALVEIAVENEKRVGVNSGGMDQAASVISLAGSALYVSFFPKLSAEPIPLPGSQPHHPDLASAIFVCANSLIVSDKAVHAKYQYNLRVVESLGAARVLAVRLGLEVGSREKITFRGVMARFMNEPEDQLEEDVGKVTEGLVRMVKVVECLRPEGAGDGDQLGVTLETMIEWSGMGEELFKDVYLSWVEVETTYFQLYKRAKHCYTEALRVLKFRDVCLTAASSPTAYQGTSAFEALGVLMNESQESCAKLYECTCPEVDELAKLALETGAYGSRVTGAGWGGCTVSLVDESQVDSFISKIKANYGPYRDLDGEALKEVIFATKPSSGVCVYKFTE
ncbi:galactokinase gal [Gyrodon lividus]|nr:galactokinase gal [Gyrodon lividus]